MTKKISKTGIFIYGSEGKPGEVLGLDEACSSLGALGFVCFKCPSSFFPGEMNDFEKFLKKNKLSKVVVAGCGLRIKEPVFRDSLKKMGLNPYLITFANLNEAVVACGDKSEATKKAVALIIKAAKWVETQEPIEIQKVSLKREVLVLGGGIAGIETALTLAEGGLSVILVEEKSHLGGGAAEVGNLKNWTRDRVETLKKNEKIKVILSSNLVDLKGNAGGFTVKIEGEQELTLEVGAIVVAVGYELVLPVWELGENFKSLIIGQKELEKRLVSDEKLPQRICFLADLVDEDLKISTRAFLRQALLIKEKFISDVICFCKDLKVSFNGGESLYKRARETGVLFFKYAEKPEIKFLNNAIEILLINEDYPHEELVFESDLLVVGEKMMPDKSFEGLAKLLSVDLDLNGFFQEDNVKILPTKSSRKGIFFVGGCRLPQNIDETLSEARGTAGEILSFLSKGEIELDLTSAKINSDRCILCLTCVRTCPHGAIIIDQEEGTAKVVPIACQSCGICASECPVMAIELPLYTNAQIIGQLSDVVGEAG